MPMKKYIDYKGFYQFAVNAKRSEMTKDIGIKSNHILKDIRMPHVVTDCARDVPKNFMVARIGI